MCRKQHLSFFILYYSHYNHRPSLETCYFAFSAFSTLFDSNNVSNFIKDISFIKVTTHQFHNCIYHKCSNIYVGSFFNVFVKFSGEKTNVKNDTPLANQKLT